MADLISNGGCLNGHRWGLDPGVADTAPLWIEAEGVDVVNHIIGVDIILALSFDGDDMNLIAGDFEVRWRNVTDAGSMAVLAATGEMNWAASTALVNGDGVPNAEQFDPGNCSGMGVDQSINDGIMREGANAADLTDIGDGEVHENWWAISTDDAVAGKTYEFEIVETGQTSPYSGANPLSATVSVLAAGKIDGTTKNKDRTAAVGGVTVSAYRSDDAGSDPKPIGPLAAQVVSHASTGVYSLTGLGSGFDYFLLSYKDDTADLSDGSPVVTAVDV
jgi:hypothetical protein